MRNPRPRILKVQPQHEIVAESASKNEIGLFPGYPASEDIYNQYVGEFELDPENPAQTKEPNEELGQRNEKDFSEDQSGDDLDVPGAELDDEQEKIGSEDEENNYYSIGGDNHNDLEENREERL